MRHCSPLPALLQGTLPEYFSIYGYARSKMSSEEFREYIGRNLTCRYCASLTSCCLHLMCI